MAFTEDQIAALRAPLDRAHVKIKPGRGNHSYIEGWHAIAEANRIFGFDGWDRELADLRVVTETATKIGDSQRDGWRVGYVAKVRITVCQIDGERVIREGTGYGSGIDVDLGSAHESAAKEAETDAMKRALMTFGNPFGLALYDKTQAEVADSPVAQRPERAAHNGQAAGSTPAGATSDSDKRIAEAAYKRIRMALREAKVPKLLDEIIDVNEHDLGFIKRINGPAYDQLVQLAIARANELRAGA
jgi:DNA recombination protein Rad52